MIQAKPSRSFRGRDTVSIWPQQTPTGGRGTGTAQGRGHGHARRESPTSRTGPGHARRRTRLPGSGGSCPVSTFPVPRATRASREPSGQPHQHVGEGDAEREGLCWG